jgi:nicotinamidase-related amidase
MASVNLPVPAHFSSDSAGRIYRVPYEQRAIEAREWARRHQLKPASADVFRIALLAIDVQNTFCVPGFELFVAGRSGHAAVDDSARLCEFPLPESRPCQSGHCHDGYASGDADLSCDLSGERSRRESSSIHAGYGGRHCSGRWTFNPEAAKTLQIDPDRAQRDLLHYAKALQEAGKYDLSVWPYHSMLGGIGHALVPAVEEAVFFHTICRYSQADFRIKGRNPFTEHYSVLGPEVSTDAEGREISRKDTELIDKLWSFDAVIIAGQAKSHCVAWTIEDLIRAARNDRRLLGKIYLLEDCTSPVVVAGVVDYTDDADEAWRRFAEAGMHVVRSTDPIDSWPGIK